MIPDPRQAQIKTDPKQDEQRQLDSVRADLVREFSSLPPEVVDEKFAMLVRAFQQAPVRSFVPVLVRRGAREQLRHLV